MFLSRCGPPEARVGLRRVSKGASLHGGGRSLRALRGLLNPGPELEQKRPLEIGACPVGSKRRD